MNFLEVLYQFCRMRLLSVVTWHFGCFGEFWWLEAAVGVWFFVWFFFFSLFILLVSTYVLPMGIFKRSTRTKGMYTRGVLQISCFLCIPSNMSDIKTFLLFYSLLAFGM